MKSAEGASEGDKRLATRRPCQQSCGRQKSAMRDLRRSRLRRQKMQLPLPDYALKIVATGEKEYLPPGLAPREGTAAAAPELPS